jgi:hypothetical protein
VKTDQDKLVEEVANLSDSDLFKLLDVVSTEMKRRNGLIGPSVDVKKNSVEENMKLLFNALSGSKK